MIILIRTATFEVCSIENKIWWQFKSRKYEEDLYGKKLLEGIRLCGYIFMIN